MPVISPRAFWVQEGGLNQKRKPAPCLQRCRTARAESSGIFRDLPGSSGTFRDLPGSSLPAGPANRRAPCPTAPMHAPGPVGLWTAGDWWGRLVCDPIQFNRSEFKSIQTQSSLKRCCRCQPPGRSSQMLQCSARLHTSAPCAGGTPCASFRWAALLGCASCRCAALLGCRGWQAQVAATATGRRVNVFNISKQSRDYDAQGAYVKHWRAAPHEVP